MRRQIVRQGSALARWLIVHTPTGLHPFLRSAQFLTVAAIGRVLRWLPGSSRRFGPPRRYVAGLAGYIAERKASGDRAALWHEVYPSATIVRSLPRSVEPTHAEFYRELQRLSPVAGVGVIGRGRVITDTGTVIGPDDRLVWDVSQTAMTDNPATHPMFLSPKLPPVTKFDGSLAVITTFQSSVYYHWMMDALPRIHLLKASNIPYDRILVPTHTRFQRECLDALGIESARVLPAVPRQHIEAERLIVPSMPGLTAHSPRWACQFVRESFLKSAPQATPRRRIFASRQKSATRKLVNEDALVEALRRYGFEPVFPEELSFAEQVRLFDGAAIVVATHGSALTNLVFCRPGASVIEIFSPNYMNTLYWALANQLDLNYHYVRGEGKRLTSKRGRRVHEDITVDPAKVTRLIDDIVAGVADRALAPAE